MFYFINFSLLTPFIIVQDLCFHFTTGNSYGYECAPIGVYSYEIRAYTDNTAWATSADSFFATIHGSHGSCAEVLLQPNNELDTYVVLDSF